MKKVIKTSSDFFFAISMLQILTVHSSKEYALVLLVWKPDK